MKNAVCTQVTEKRCVRLGFAGVGWIGLNRLKAATELGFVEAMTLFDPSPESMAQAKQEVPSAECVESFEALLEQELDGIVIATPSALHAEQSIAALERGLPVFCQKPLARTGDEMRAVIDTARRSNLLLMTDLSYRYIRGVDRVRDLIQSGELGQVYALDLTFHNAYGPNKPWFFDHARSGGGCLIDLGTHLIDLALFLSDAGEVDSLDSRLFREGQRLTPPIRTVEDFASIAWDHVDGPTVRLACSWTLSAGRDAVIEANCYGTKGAVALRNEGGSFFDFTVERFRGTNREQLAEPDRGWNWGGGAIRDFATRLERGDRYDSGIESLVDVAAILDRSYGR